jgi:hypothetical protein
MEARHYRSRGDAFDRGGLNVHRDIQPAQEEPDAGECKK